MNLLLSRTQRIHMAGRAVVVAVCTVCCSIFYLALQAQPHYLPLFSAQCNAIRSWLVSAVFGILSLRLMDTRLFLISYDVWSLVRSMVTSLQLTGCSLNLFHTKSRLPVNDYYRNGITRKSMQSYYKVFIVVFCILSLLYTINFVLSFLRFTIDSDENWVDCNNYWADDPTTLSYDYDYLMMDIKKRKLAVQRMLTSRRRRTATTRRLRTKYSLSESIKKIF